MWVVVLFVVCFIALFVYAALCMVYSADERNNE